MPLTFKELMEMNKDTEWGLPVRDVCDAMWIIEAWFKDEAKIPYTAADLIEATKLVIRRRETYDTV